MSRLRALLLRLGGNIRGMFDLESSGEVMAYAVLVGVVAGLGAWVFAEGSDRFRALALEGVVGYRGPDHGAAAAEPREGESPSPGAGAEGDSPTPAEVERARLADPLHGVRWWAVLLVPTLGGLACGWLVYTFAPEAEGHGTDALVRSFHRLGGEVRGRVPILKGLASIVTIGTGGSAGREGPIAQIGSGFGSFLAGRLGLGATQRRQLALAGAAGGIAAIFQAPLGGALFVCEVLYGSTAIEFAAVIPSVIAAVVAYSVFTGIHGPGHELNMEHFSLHAPDQAPFIAQLPFFIVFAVLCAVVGFIYVKTFYGLRDHFFNRLPLPRLLRPALGGLLLGGWVLLLRTPHVMGSGYGWIQLALDGRFPEGGIPLWQMMALLCFAKIVATSLTISSGGSGGVFAPSLFIGAMLGGAYGQLCELWFPGVFARPEIFVLIGMGGFFAGVAKVPLTAALMVSEMTGSYDLVIPILLVSIVNVAILSWRVSLYEEQLRSLIDSPAHAGEFVVDVLAGIRVRDVLDPRLPVTRVPQDMPLSRVLPLIAASRGGYFPVVDAEDRLVGIFSLSDIRAVFEGNEGGDWLLAADIATFPVITVTPEDDLHTALRRVTQKNIEEIPVVDPEDPRRVIGMLRRKEVIAAYQQEMAALRKQT